MATSHLLTDVQQQTIVARLSNIYRCLEDMTFAHLSAITLCSRHVDHIRLLTSYIRPLTERHALVAWIKLRQSVIVPQNAVTLAGNQHGQTNLRVHLCQPTRQATHIAIAILKLAQTKQAFVLCGGKSQCSLTIMKTVASGGKYRLATFIPNHNLLTLSVNLNFHILALYCTMFNIQPIRQIARLPTTLDILDTDGITRHSLHL